MTVIELIAELQRHPEHMDVRIAEFWNGTGPFYNEPMDPHVAHDDENNKDVVAL